MAEEVENKKTITRTDLIKKARRTMMIAVIAASIVVGIGFVGIRRLMSENIFVGRVIAEKGKTLDNIKKSQANLPTLENKIKILATDENLASARFDSKEAILRVVPDSLPSVYNEASLGTSLSERILKSGIENEVTIESVRTGNSASVSTTAPATVDGLKTASFTFTVSGNASMVTRVLENLERSIRFLDVSQISITYSGNVQMNVRGVAYYIDETVVRLTSTTITAGGR